MNDETHRDENDLERLAGALGYDPQREPPPGRVAAIRAAADELRRSRQGADADSGQGPGADDLSGRRRHRRDETAGRGPGRRGLIVGGVAASIGVLAGLSGRELLADEPPEVPTEPIAFSGAPARVEVDASLINHTWGTELLLDVAGLADGEVYDVAYLDAAGAATGAGSFVGVADVLMVCRFNAAPLRADVSAITVVDSTGAEVMRADLA